MLKGKEDQIDSFFKRHDETGHGRLGEGDRVAVADLFNPERNHGATGAHDVAVTGAANLGVTGVTTLGHCDFFLNGFGDTHSVDWISGFVR